jgi:hypothetical protein
MRNIYMRRKTSLQQNPQLFQEKRLQEEQLQE